MIFPLPLELIHEIHNPFLLCRTKNSCMQLEAIEDINNLPFDPLQAYEILLSDDILKPYLLPLLPRQPCLLPQGVPFSLRLSPRCINRTPPLCLCIFLSFRRLLELVLLRHVGPRHPNPGWIRRCRRIQIPLCWLDAGMLIQQLIRAGGNWSCRILHDGGGGGLRLGLARRP